MPNKLEGTLIADSEAFQGVAESDLDEIVRHARARRYDKNAAVFEQGATAESFFVLLDGHIKVVQMTADGQQVVVRFVNPGELFGIAAAIGKTNYPATAIAAAECVTLVWAQSYWRDLTTRYPSITANLLRNMGGHLQDQHSRLREMATQRVERRIAHVLLRLVRQAGKKTDQGIEIDFPITRQDLAEMTGTTLFTVSRVMSSWDQAGITEGERQRIVVRNPHALVDIAEDAADGRADK